MSRNPTDSTEKTQTVESDGFDRDLYERQVRLHPGLKGPRERLGRLLPDSEALLFDLFCVLYKLNVVPRHPSSLPPSAQLARRVVGSLVDDARLERLRERTQLDATAAQEALVFLSHSVADALTQGDRLVAQEFMEGLESHELESELSDVTSQIAHLEELPEDAFGPDLRENLKKDLNQDKRRLERAIEKKKKAMRQVVHDLPVSFDHEVAGAMGQWTDERQTLEEAMAGLGLGSGESLDPSRRFELGKRLLRSRKLQMLARLLGAFREIAQEVRKRRLPRSPQSVHDIRTGNDLFRILPSELTGLRRPELRRAFRARFAESQLLQYELEGPKARGPMVVCVDGSSSMEGSKELWSKAVALTFVELARRERRRCVGIVFSGGPEIHEVELSSEHRGLGQRAALVPEAVLDFAEHFPGGGTSFREPLTRALEHVESKRFRRGDIVFITDGEAPVGPELVERVEDVRKRTRTAIKSIVIDAGSHRIEGVESFSDQVFRVRDLAEDAVGELFR
ncbi:MAG TPA: hypothetical protein RMG48_00485 [Myxococcales bacterium LLY-WYZ-16_1]|nr:hypothetical protein [Myxococcales bacterium LLY-WYZ-16_1]